MDPNRQPQVLTTRAWGFFLSSLPRPGTGGNDKEAVEGGGKKQGRPHPQPLPKASRGRRPFAQVSTGKLLELQRRSLSSATRQPLRQETRACPPNSCTAENPILSFSKFSTVQERGLRFIVCAGRRTHTHTPKIIHPFRDRQEWKWTATATLKFLSSQPIGEERAILASKGEAVAGGGKKQGRPHPQPLQSILTNHPFQFQIRLVSPPPTAKTLRLRKMPSTSLTSTSRSCRSGAAGLRGERILHSVTQDHEF